MSDLDRLKAVVEEMITVIRGAEVTNSIAKANLSGQSIALEWVLKRIEEIRGERG